MQDQEPDEKLTQKMQSLCRHQYIQFMERGNSAIFIAMHIAKNINPKPNIVIPDQGGWFSYKKFPKFLGLNIVEVKTDYGIIDLDDLKKKADNASAFIFTSFAGYFAEQPLKEIKEICTEAGCLVIEDATGAIGDTTLCNGNYSDIIVGSFGKWKPVNYGYGGWLSTNEKKFLDCAGDALALTKVHSQFYQDILPYLEKNRVEEFLALQEKVKKDLERFDIIHRNKRGINVVVRYHPDVIAYCEEKGYPYVLCPNYTRVNENAISIELKRLENI